MADTRALSPILRTVSGGIFTRQNPVAQPKEKLLDANEISLRRVSNQLSTLTVQMNSISASLEKVAAFTQQDTLLEQLKTKQDQDQERRIAEEAVRTKEEGIIENKIKSALVAPIKIIAEKTQSVLSKLMSMFTTFLGGWLLIKGIDTLKALSEGNTTKLEEIKNAVIKSLGIAGVTLYLLNGGFFAIAGTIASITLNIAKGLGKLIFIKPFQLLLQGISKITPKPIATAAAGVGGFLSKGAGALKGATKLLTGIGGVMDAATGQITDAALAGGALFAPGALKAPFAALYGADAIAEMFGVRGGAGLFGENPNEKEKKPEAKPEAKPKAKPNTPAMPPKPSIQSNEENRPPDISLPTENQSSTPPSAAVASSSLDTTVAPPSPEMVQKFEMAWQYKDNPMERGRIEDAWNNMSPVEKQQAQTWAQSKGYDWSKMNLPAYTPPQTQGTPQAQITPIPVSEMQQRSEQLNTPLAEPKPTVVMARSSSGGGQDTGANQPPPVGESANSVPSISSSNPENFYTLYSQVHYNVVM